MQSLCFLCGEEFFSFECRGSRVVETKEGELGSTFNVPRDGGQIRQECWESGVRQDGEPWVDVTAIKL